MEQKHFTCDNCGSEQVADRISLVPRGWVLVTLEWGYKNPASAQCCTQNCAIEWVRQNTA